VLYDEQNPEDVNAKGFDFVANFHLCGIPTAIDDENDKATKELEKIFDYITSIKNLSECMTCGVITQKECQDCGNSVCSDKCLIPHHEIFEHEKQ